MKKRKFFLGILLLIVVLLVGVVGTAAPTRISVWGIFRPNETDMYGVWLLEQIKAFEAANPDIRIDYNYTDNEAYKTKLQVAMLGGAGPDILYNWGGETQAIYSREGMLYDLTKHIDKNYWGLSKGLFSTHTYQGKIYGIPMFPTVNSVWYNKEMFEKYGLKAPATWSEFMDVCEKLKKKGIIPFSIGGKDAWTILHPFMYLADRTAGAELYSKAKAGTARFDHPDFVRAFALLETLSKKGYLPPDVLNLTYGDATQLMVRDRAAMMSQGNWLYNILTSESTKDFDKWDFFPFPVIEGGKGDPKAVIGCADGFSINESCKHPEAAVKFLKFITSKKSIVDCHQKTHALVAMADPYMDESAQPQVKKVATLLAEATSLTQWWDQDLPAPMTQALLQGLQEILAGIRTPKQVATALEEAR